MKKIKFLKLIIPALFIAMASFSGCEKTNTVDNNSQETWVWSFDGLTTLDLYSSENKYHTTVVGDFSDPSHIGDRDVLFANNTWTYYKMVGDTMYVRGENENFPPIGAQYGKWLIHQHTEQYLEMEYMGTLPAIPIITDYLFNR